MHRVIVDTNLWISFLITKDFSKLEELIISNKIQLLFSAELLEEIATVMKRPKFQKYFSKKDTLYLELIISNYADFIDVKSYVDICRDKKDNFLLALAKDRNADFLITGDKDLLAIKQIANTSIITITEFLVIINSNIN